MSKRSFQLLAELFEEASGIRLSADKENLMIARLGRRLDALGLTSFDAYCELLRKDEAGSERGHAVDLLTTNETYFFREPAHFVELAGLLSERFRGRPVRLWSAACSSGEEPYSMAMTLLDRRPMGGWELCASDLSLRVLEQARLGVYPMQRLDGLPQGYLKRFFMRGTGEFEGTVRMSEDVRKAVRYFQHNLLSEPRALGTFTVVFLRNVLIYFDEPRKKRILSNITGQLERGGMLFVGHAEPLSLHGLPLRKTACGVYEKS